MYLSKSKDLSSVVFLREQILFQGCISFESNDHSKVVFLREQISLDCVLRGQISFQKSIFPIANIVLELYFYISPKSNSFQSCISPKSNSFQSCISPRANIFPEFISTESKYLPMVYFPKSKYLPRVYFPESKYLQLHQSSIIVNSLVELTVTLQPDGVKF